MAFEVSVPLAAGIPPVLRPQGFVGTIEAITSDLISTGFGQEAWGIYLGGSPVVTAESVASVDYRQDWSVSDFQIEQGGFQSYDKVQIPYDGRIRFSAGGSEASRTALLDSIAAIAGTLTLYDFVTPTAVYTNANVVHFDYRRTNEAGRGLLIVDVWVQEVRISQSSTMSNTAMPSGADTVNGGQVEPVDLGQGGIGSDAVASAQAASAAANFTPVTTTSGSAGIGSA